MDFRKQAYEYPKGGADVWSQRRRMHLDSQEVNGR